MRVKAAVLHHFNEQLKIVELELRAPQAGEVLVKLRASGICHTDITLKKGIAPFPLPSIFGHEGAGEVIEVGEGVKNVVKGDHVILNNLPECGKCKHCKAPLSNLCVQSGLTEQKKEMFFMPEDYAFKSPYSTLDGKPVGVELSGPATFATHCVVPENYVCPFPKNVPFEEACLLGCGVTTGFGCANDATQVYEGSTVIVIGTGAIGLNAVQSAKIAGASIVIACDSNPKKESFARQFGATHFILSENGKVNAIAEQTKSIVGSNFVDFAFDTTGSVPILEMAIQLTHPYSGVCLAIGIKPQDIKLDLPSATFTVGRTVRGVYNGNAKPISAEKRILELYAQKKYIIAPLITHRITLNEINEGFELLAKGEAVRVIISYD